VVHFEEVKVVAGKQGGGEEGEVGEERGRRWKT
jgi:hypothetical protein